MSIAGRKASTNEVWAALKECRSGFAKVGVFSACINILSLTGSIYMLQISDRVLASHSVSTLVGLSLLALAAYAAHGMLDALRHRILARLGLRFATRLGGRVYDAVTELSLKQSRPVVATQSIRDLDQVQKFLSGMGPTAFFDFPFLPVFLAISYLMHPLFAVLILVGSLLIVGLSVLTELKTRGPTISATVSDAVRQTVVETLMRNAEAIRAMGMAKIFLARFQHSNARHAAHGLEASDVVSGIGSAAKISRAILQSAVLGLGAFLAIKGEVTPGAMLAASILSARALAPVEIAVAHWRGWIAARQAFFRLDRVMCELGPTRAPLALPEPTSSLSVQNLYVTAPEQTKPILHNLSFELKRGDGLAIIGPSASGKSTLARALIGVWPAARGRICLDGASIDHWDRTELGRQIGYLPQDIELFEGTVAENIARFDSAHDPRSIVNAARSAGAHDMILRLPEGYETRLGEGGASLSAGQRQRIALARALYRAPFLVVLDEPNSNLDSEGEDALVAAMLSVRERGGIVIVVTHRPTALASVDLVAVMIEGRIQSFGPKQDVLGRMTRLNSLHGAGKKTPAQETA